MRHLTRHAVSAIALFAGLLTACTSRSPEPPAAGAQALVNPATEKKIDALLAQMTLEEKVGQLNQYSSPFDMTGPPPGPGRAEDWPTIRSEPAWSARC